MGCLMKNVQVRNKVTGKLCKYPVELITEDCKYELYVEPVVESEVISYSDLKDKARDLEIEFKGNISKKKLQELVDSK